MKAHIGTLGKGDVERLGRHLGIGFHLFIDCYSVSYRPTASISSFLDCSCLLLGVFQNKSRLCKTFFFCRPECQTSILMHTRFNKTLFDGGDRDSKE